MNYMDYWTLKITLLFEFSGSDDDDVVIAAFKSFDEEGKIDSER